MNSYSLYLLEALDTKVPYDVFRANDDTFTARAEIAGKVIEFSATDEGEYWDVAFMAKGAGARNTFGLTGDKAELQVFSFVKAAFTEFVRRYAPGTIEFTADKDGGSNTRAALYERMLKRFAAGTGYSYKAQAGANSTKFTMTARR